MTILERIMNIIGTIAGLFLILFLAGIASLAIFFPRYDVQDLIKNYRSNSEQIHEVVNYVNAITPKNIYIHLEFGSNRTLEIFHVNKADFRDDNWDLRINSRKTDSLLKQLNWTRETLKEIKQKLDAANCISIETGSPFTIGYKRSGMDMLFYKLFDKPLTPEEKKTYNDGCMFKQYTNNVVLEYGSGAFGSICHGDFKKKVSSNGSTH